MKNFSKAVKHVGLFNTLFAIGFYRLTGQEVAITDDGIICARGTQTL